MGGVSSTMREEKDGKKEECDEHPVGVTGRGVKRRSDRWTAGTRDESVFWSQQVSSVQTHRVRVGAFSTQKTEWTSGEQTLR